MKLKYFNHYSELFELMTVLLTDCTYNVIKDINQSSLSPVMILHHSGFNSRLTETHVPNVVRVLP